MVTFSTEPATDYGRQLVVDGETILDSRADPLEIAGEIRLFASLDDPRSVPRVTRYRVSELATHFHVLRFPMDSPIAGLQLSAIVDFANPRDTQTTLTVEYGIDLDEWSGPWSLAEYTRVIEETVVANPESGLVPDREFHERVGSWGLVADLSANLRNEDATLDAVLEHWLPRAEQIIRAARQTLTDELDRNTLVTLFDFPGHVSTACEQYLLYFVQFLRDLGIEAGASIKHEASQVLFSVTPEDGSEALDRIRDALEVYLRLPDSPEFIAQAADYGDIAVQQLQANIYHLKGQLVIANAVLQAKNAQIEALELSNFRYQQLLASEQQVAAIPLLPPSTPKTDTEPLVPGVIDITKYEGKGFTVNLAEVLRRLKRRFN